MSGFRNTMMNSSASRPAEPSGQKGPQRDAWNNPVEEPPEQRRTNTNTNIDPNAQVDDKDDGTIDDEDVENIWRDIKKGKTTDGQQQQQQDNRQQQQQQQVDPKQQLQQYLKEAGLGEFTLSETEKTELTEGKFDTFNAKILNLIQTAHTKALSGAATLIDSKVQAAVKAAVDQSKGYMAGVANVEALNKALPYTKDASIGPVAQTVMQRFLDRGANTEQAIEGVRRWGKKFVSLADPDRQVNSNRNGNFRDGNQSSEGENTNWMDLLSPKSR